MRVLITGSSGFIGSNTCELIRADGNEIYEVDKANKREPVDINNLSALSAVFSRFEPEVIIHLAAIASVPVAEQNPLDVYITNVIGTLNVVECSRKFNAKVILASSGAVYGEPAILPTPETAPLTPVNVYGATKIAAEQIVSLRAKKWVILRLFNVYGQKCNRSYVIPDIIRKIRQGQNPIRALGTGEEKRDFVYVNDVIKAFMVGIKKNTNGVFNVGSGKTVRIRDLVEEIIRIVGKETQCLFAGSKRLGDFSCNWADISKIKNELGWKPEISLEDGLEKTAEWFDDSRL